MHKPGPFPGTVFFPAKNQVHFHGIVAGRVARYGFRMDWIKANIDATNIRLQIRMYDILAIHINKYIYIYGFVFF